MIAVRARRKWAGPLLVLIVIVAVLILVAGVARGESSGTPFSTSATLSGEAGGQAGAIAGDEGLTVFTTRAGDFGLKAAKPPAITSPSAIVVNAASGHVLYARKADRRLPMASTTKIMTGILVLEALRLDQEVMLSQKAGLTYEPKPLLRPGDVLTVRELLYALMVRSSNGAAVALAEAVDGSVDAFAERMNAKAAELGMADTHFVNPNGLDAQGHYSTAADMAKVACYAMADARFKEFAGTRSHTLALPGRAAVKMESTNKLLLRADWVTGIKTGLTPWAEQCLVASADRDGVSVVSVLLGQPVSEVCWNESQALLLYGLGRYRHVILMEQGTPVAEAEAPYQREGVVRLVTAEAVETDLYEDDEVTTTVRLERQLALPVEAGEAFGRVVVSLKGETVGSVDLVIDRSFADVTLGTKIAYYVGRFADWLGG